MFKRDTTRFTYPKKFICTEGEMVIIQNFIYPRMVTRGIQVIHGYRQPNAHTCNIGLIPETKGRKIQQILTPAIIETCKPPYLRV